MSLRTKLFLLSIVVFLLSVLTTAALVEVTVRPSFRRLEDLEARRHMRRCLFVLNKEAEYLDMLNHDWSAWDDTYEFALDRNQDYIDSNLTDTTFTDSRLNLILFLDPDGKEIWGRAVRLDNLAPIPISSLIPQPVPGDSFLLRDDSPNAYLAGLYHTEAGPMFISARPILTSDNLGPARGTLIMGRFLTTDMIRNLAEQVQLAVNFWTPEGKSIISNLSIMPPEFRDGETIAFKELGDSVLMAITQVHDVFGETCMLMDVRLERHILMAGRASIAIFYSLSLFGGLFIVLGLFLFLKGTVTSPLRRLTDMTAQVEGSHTPEPTGLAERDDEIGILATAFESMLTRLSEARKSLMERSYQSGQSATAAGLMHNVRNILTPMSAEMEMLSSHLESLAPVALDRAVEELSDPAVPAGRRQELTQYLTLSVKRIRQAHSEDRAILCSCLRRLGRVEEILHSYSHLTHSGPVLESLDLAELIRDAEGFLPRKLRSNLVITNHIGEMEILAERITFMQVVANILGNAAEASLETSGKAAEVTIHALGQDDDCLSIAFSDKGPGILPEIRERVFQRGFSTKKDTGHTGLGLHWCSTTLTALNGSMRIEDGPGGKGVSVIITIPRAGASSSEEAQ